MASAVSAATRLNIVIILADDLGYPLTRRAPNLAAGVALDYDNDSHVDLIFVDRQDGLPADDDLLNPWIFRNTGGGQFEHLSSGVDGLSGHFNDLSYGDFDRNGRLDIVFVNGDPGGGGRAVVFRNAAENSNRWIALNFGWPDNKLGIGSIVSVFKAGTDEVLGHDEVRTDFCYRSKGSTTLHFGLGQEESVDVTVTTPNGIGQRFDRLTTDKKHELRIAVPWWESFCRRHSALQSRTLLSPVDRRLL